MKIDLRARGIRAIVLDIEGTTTPLAFVHQVLFPYARLRLGEYLDSFLVTDEGREWLQRARSEWSTDAADDVTAYSIWLMDRDRKSPALKDLQGRIWERGYRTGELQGDVFPDVPPALTRWRAAGIEVAIYSSGSVLAQRLLFGHTRYGDLTPFLKDFFDTGVGPKSSADSYRAISAALDRPASEVLFVSDVVAELDAARSAGMSAVLSIRPGNAPARKTVVPTIHDFDAL